MPDTRWHVERIDHDTETDTYDVYLQELPRRIGATLDIVGWVLRGLDAEQAAYFKLGHAYNLADPTGVPDSLIRLPLRPIRAGDGEG